MGLLLDEHRGDDTRAEREFMLMRQIHEAEVRSSGGQGSSSGIISCISCSVNTTPNDALATGSAIEDMRRQLRELQAHRPSPPPPSIPKPSGPEPSVPESSVHPQIEDQETFERNARGISSSC